MYVCLPVHTRQVTAYVGTHVYAQSYRRSRACSRSVQEGWGWGCGAGQGAAPQPPASDGRCVRICGVGWGWVGARTRVCTGWCGSRDPPGPPPPTERSRPRPPSRSPSPGPRRILPKGFIKTQRTETGTHRVRSGCGGIAYSCHQPPARGRHRGAVGVTALAGVPVPAPAAPPSLPPASPPPACPKPGTPGPSASPRPRCRDGAGAPRGSAGARRRSRRGWAGSGSGAGSTHALAQTPRGHRNGPYREAREREPARPQAGAPSSGPGSGAPAGLPSHPTPANKTRHKHRDSPSLRLSPPCPDKLFKSSIRKCKKCTRKWNPRPSRSGDGRGVASVEAHLKQERESPAAPAAARLPRQQCRHASPALPPATGQLSAGGPGPAPGGCCRQRGELPVSQAPDPPTPNEGQGEHADPPGRGSQLGRPARGLREGSCPCSHLRCGHSSQRPHPDPGTRGGSPERSPWAAPPPPRTRAPTGPQQRAQPYLSWKWELRRKIVGTAKYLQ